MWKIRRLGDGLNLIEGPGGIRIELQHPVYVDFYEDDNDTVYDAGAFKIKVNKASDEIVLFVVNSSVLIEFPISLDAFSMISGCMVKK